MKNLNEITEKDFFFCYTKKLSDFLRDNGMRYIIKAHSVKDGNLFSLYPRTSELTKLLIKFKQVN